MILIKSCIEKKILKLPSHPYNLTFDISVFVLFPSLYVQLQVVKKNVEKRLKLHDV